MSRLSLIKKCIEVMSPEQQDQVVESCVSIVAASSRTFSGAAPTKKNKPGPKPKTKPKAKAAKAAKGKSKTVVGRKPISLVVGGVEYKSIGKFCEINNLNKSAIYSKVKTIKTPKAKQNFLEASLAAVAEAAAAE